MNPKNKGGHVSEAGRAARLKSMTKKAKPAAIATKAAWKSAPDAAIVARWRRLESERSAALETVRALDVQIEAVKAEAVHRVILQGVPALLRAIETLRR